MPNINAALLLAQLENLGKFLKSKRKLAARYMEFFNDKDVIFMTEPRNSKSNYWLNSIFLDNRQERDSFLEITNKNLVQTRLVWTLMYKLPMYKNCFKGETPNAEYIEERVANLPSGMSKEWIK